MKIIFPRNDKEFSFKKLLGQEEDYSSKYENNIILNNKDLKNQYIREYLSSQEKSLYESYIYNCYFDFNFPIYQDSSENITITILSKDQQLRLLQKVYCSEKNYFTIGRIGKQILKTSNKQIPTVELLLNEVEIKETNVDFMHLEINYGNISLNQNQQGFFNKLQMQMNNKISQSTMELMWNLIKSNNNNCLKLKNLASKQQPPLIQITNLICRSNQIEYGNQFIVGTIIKLQIKNVYSQLQELFHFNQQGSEIKIIEKYLKKGIKILGMPSRLGEAFDRLIQDRRQNLRNINEDFTQEFIQLKQSSALHFQILNSQENDFEYILIQGNYTFGRSVENNIIINNSHISRKHGMIKFYQGSWYLCDGQEELGELRKSSSGIWRIIEKDKYQEINQDNIIKLGSQKLQFNIVNIKNQDINKQSTNLDQTNLINEILFQ